MSNLDYSVAVRTARAQAVETTIGTSPTLEIRTGTKPTDCAAADSGTVLATITLPSDWLSVASGATTLSGTWTDAAADATGTAGHYRIKGGGVCHEQGTITASGGGGVLTLDDITIDAGQTVTITSWNRTEGNA